MRRALVTGVGGFIGSSLAGELLDAAAIEVVGIDSLTDYYPPELKRRHVEELTNRGLEFHQLDLTCDELGGVLDNVDVIFHLAGQPGVRPSWGESFANYVRDNITATQKLLEAARKSTSLQRLVYASSSSVYGDAERYPTFESDRPMPLSPYGVTKLAAENLCSLYAHNFGLPTVSLRYFTVYGPRQRPDMAFTRFIVRALLDEPLEVFGDGRAIRDFTYVGDIVNANIAAATANVPPGSIFNISGGASTDMRTVLSYIERLCECPVKIVWGESVPGDVSRTGGDSGRAADMLGWQPRTDLLAGLGAQVAWAKDVLPEYRELV